MEKAFATLSDRFAALLIDLIVIGYLAVGGYLFFGERLQLPAIDLSQLRTLQHTALLGVTAGLIFAYFFS